MTSATDNAFINDIARGEQTAVLAWRHWLEERAEWGDAAAKARLEFCEVQERVEKLRADGHGDNCMCLAAMRARQPKSGAQALPTCEECFTLQHAEHAAAALLREHEATWRASGPCIYCEGKGRGSACDEPNVDGVTMCPSCYGTGDRGGLMRTWALSERHDAGLLEGNDRFSRKVHWRAGLPYAVECRLEDVLTEECPDCRASLPSAMSHCPHPRAKWRVTEWAKSVVRWHPVERFALTGRDCGGEAKSFLRDDHLREPYSLPGELFEVMYRLRLHWQRDGRWLYFDSRGAGLAALATAAGVLVRREVWGAAGSPAA